MASTGRKKHRAQLGEAFATAICGNGILSSILYVSGIAVLFAGVWAPIVMLLIGGVLVLYKLVYTEVVEALPINGGAYNCLLNGTSKTVAATAGIMTFLSYIATAVISAKIGTEYLGAIIPLPVIPVTLVLLFGFAVLALSGVKDSARVALGIFITHIATLALFLAAALYDFWQGHSEFATNFARTADVFARQGGMMPALYLAFAASLLGVSSFESSANFVEEQRPGVFRKTLRNMLIGTVVFNPLVAVAVLNAMPYDAIAASKDFLLVDAARIIAGPWLRYLVAIDAFLVLAGAVLVAYVGVSGLLQRMAGDGCIPAYFRRPNSKGAYPRIVVLFFALAGSILVLTRGDLFSLAGVYAISFLGVMAMFAVGNLILKESRPELKRTYSAPITVVVLAFLAALLGIFGNIRIDDQNITFFELYFIPALVIVLVVIYQDRLVHLTLRLARGMPILHRLIARKFEDITSGRFVVFVRKPERLYKTLNYINRNETGRKIMLVSCPDPEHADPHKTYEQIKIMVPMMQAAGVFPHLQIDMMYEDMEFGPEAIDHIARKLKIGKNRIFIGSIHDSHPFAYQELGGVRIIF